MYIDQPKKIAVIGGGVAGVTAAWLLSKKHDVALFEKNSAVGGHTNTVLIEEGPDQGLGVDTGFIVCNNRTYENFHRLLAELGCSVRSADMSFGYQDQESGLQYSGTSFNGLFAQRRNLFSPTYLSFLVNVRKFMARSREALKVGADISGSLGDFLKAAGVSESAMRHYILPMGAAIWSAPREAILAFPASTFLHFFENHGLLSVTDMPQWQTVVGGSHAYMKAFQRRFRGTIHRSQPVRSLRRAEGKVLLSLADGQSPQLFDSVVIASHADEALKLLEDPGSEEQRLLGAWSYQPNQAVLHTDESLLPSNLRARASWNYLREASSGEGREVTVTYDMNRLQGFRTQKQYCVSLNSARKIDSSLIIKTIEYRHPVFDARGVATQPELPSLNGSRQTWFCGSYFGYGFHEDAVKSGVAVAADFGVGW